MHGPSEDLVHHWGLSGHPGRILWGPVPPVMHQPDFAPRRNVGAEHFAPPSQGPKKSISASWSIRAPLAALTDPDSIAGRNAMPRTQQRGIDIPICGGGVHSHPAWCCEQTQLRPKTSSWYTTCVSHACRIPGRSRWGSSERASSLALMERLGRSKVESTFR